MKKKNARLFITCYVNPDLHTFRFSKDFLKEKEKEKEILTSTFNNKLFITYGLDLKILTGKDYRFKLLKE